ncbi:type III pantothenate kinase [Idiomarina fontislapidosi]|uniref:Type III pantothenate kinase n=1 Tax=Idiomarina fontislapidosi TaxID=263723 RepID=A0A432XUP7_9GAMM|nr:type III pantothenate kinase [Idiomarina fontislapidosi]PYE31872.1 type III pantothenate kinase [Idiomarina fontislapidosi]RUO52456.1 type III pantothenate kinase [Idiomarina fontislapidosi]
MRLVIDNGNTRTKLAIYQNNELIHEYKYVNAELLSNERWLDDLKDVSIAIETAFGCSVANQEVREAIERGLHVLSIEVEWLGSAGTWRDVKNAYAEPKKLGADRWFALLGYRVEAHNHCMIIDAGTAMTIDWMDASGCHLGGWIIPGRRLMHESMHQKTALVKGELAEDCFREPANNTATAMSYGVHYALVGAISQGLHVSRQQFADEPFDVVVTGGDGERLIQSLSCIEPISYIRKDDLVFKGLLAAADSEL